jgi:hypothetical protein
LLSFRNTNDSLDAEVGSGDAARAEAALGRMVDQVELLQERAPDDIKSHVDVVATFVVGFRDLMSRYDYDLAKIETEPNAVAEFEAINNDAVQVSLGQLQAYGDQDCAAAGESTTTTTA